MRESDILSIKLPQAISRAVDLIRSGGLIAFPTDTVYGIGVSAFHTDAIDRIYRVKGRSTLKAIPILLGDAEIAEQITPSFSPIVKKLTENYWPGPLTLIVPLHSSLPENLSSTPTIGLRVPDHEFTLTLLRKTGPLAATSANISGESSALSAEEVQFQLGGKVDLILDGGRSPGGLASTVLDCTGKEPVILREGPLTWEDIQSELSGSTF